MKIGIDARLYSKTGIGRYIRNLLENLSRIDDRNEYLIYLTSEDFHLFDIPTDKWQKKILDIRWHSVGEQFFLPMIFSKDKIDLMHFPYFSMPILYQGNYVLTVHDLIIDHFDTGRASTKNISIYKLKRAGYKIIFKYGIKNAAKILAISNTTKKEILDHYDIDKEKVTVTLDSVDEKFVNLVKKYSPVKKFNFPYILYVGNAYPHKNVERLIEALNFRNLKNKIKLVLVGDDDYFYHRLKEFVKLQNLEGKVIFFGKANDRDLLNLYSYAKILVSPSLMEGFGLPNLEATVCNCLPLMSDIPAFREVWGNHLLYFNPTKTESISDAIDNVLNINKREYMRLLDTAKTQQRKYSWSNTARRTLKAYMMSYSL